MTISIYQASVPAFLSMLKNLTAFLDKAEAFAVEHKIAEDVLLNWLAPDMFPFSAGVPSPLISPRERHSARPAPRCELPGRREDFRGAESAHRQDRDVRAGPERGTSTVRRNATSHSRSAARDALQRPSPVGALRVANFYSATAAYAILRRCGVELGKRDFLGGI
jgi:hypothetical protein